MIRDWGIRLGLMVAILHLMAVIIALPFLVLAMIPVTIVRELRVRWVDAQG